MDEAGRGAWAGPVVAGAVILPAVTAHTARQWPQSRVFRTLARVNDSKQLTPHLREELFDPICACALASATGMASHGEIDALGILRATHLAMHRALAALTISPDALLIDALVLPEIEIPQQGLIRGDALSLSIAAASILAKVTRDRLMCNFDAMYPGYHWAQHKGYGTRAHQAALDAQGSSPIHRQSYAPVRAVTERHSA